MSRRIRAGLLGISLGTLAIPACAGLQVAKPVPIANEQEERTLAGNTMPAVAVSRPIAPVHQMGMRFWDTLIAKPPHRGLEPPTPLGVEVVPSQVEATKVEPVRVEAVVPAAPPAAVADQATQPAQVTAEATEEVPVDTPLIEALRSYQNKSPDRAAQQLRQYERPSRDLLACLLPVAARLAEGDITKADPQDLAVLVEQMQGLLTPLRERAALEIPKLCFCRPAPGRSSVYELLDANHLFRPGEMVALYMEVRNFTCMGQGEDYRTHIVTSVEIRDEHGHTVYRFDEPVGKPDPSLSPRQDFVNGLRFALPPLSAGAFTLKLTATDVPSGRTATRSLDFRVTTIPARGM